VSIKPKVFGVGLSKTGTTSLYAALHAVGLRSGTFGHLRSLGLEEWFAGDFSRDYLREYDAVTDLPVGAFFPQLDARYPGSKFILTVREDMELWLDSCRKQFTQPPGNSFSRDTHLVSYGTSCFNAERYRYVYEAHLASTKEYFKNRPQDLLVFNIIGGEGWEVLCPFMGVPLPETSFPNVKPGHRVEGDPLPSRSGSQGSTTLAGRVVGRLRRLLAAIR